MTNRYSFGKNWKRFLDRNLNEERIGTAKNKLLESLRLPHLRGRTFLDIGCGSGLHSLAAFEAGAQKILSLDYDQDSVEATESLWSRSGCPDHWTIMQGDVLDRAQIELLGQWDIVYSWGVLHHTGQVWEALRNTSIPLAEDGVLLVALYTSDVYSNPAAELALKRKYNESNPLGQRLMEGRFFWKNLIYPSIRSLRPWAPLTTIIKRQQQRGMSYYTDVRDWLGGWPMEFTGVAETRAFAQDQLGLKLVACYGGAGNTEYLLCLPGSDCHWNRLGWTEKPTVLVPPFTPVGTYAFSAPAPPWIGTSSDLTAEDLKAMYLTEDNQILGPTAADQKQIRRFGSGAFNVVDGHVIFSSSDNSDPNHNGRIYGITRLPKLSEMGEIGQEKYRDKI